MSTLYKPVTIETEYQAGEFPEGTIAQHPEHRTVAVKTDMWEDDHLLWYDTDDGSQSPASLIGWTALVPIEAEEDYAIRGDEWLLPVEADYPRNELEDGWTFESRLVTPWENA